MKKTQEVYYCPTCETEIKKPGNWTSNLVIWGNVLLLNMFFIFIVLDPLPSVTSKCVKQIKAGLGNGAGLSSCYAPSEPWLALGWIAEAGLFAFVALAIYQDYSRLARWNRVHPQLKTKSVPWLRW